MLTARRDLLVAVLDTLIPAGDDFPAAGGVAADHVLAMAARSADLGRLLSRGLAAVDATGDFLALDAARREDVLRRVEASDGAFFEALVRHAYDGYYSAPAVVARLG